MLSFQISLVILASEPIAIMVYSTTVAIDPVAPTVTLTSVISPPNRLT